MNITPQPHCSEERAAALVKKIGDRSANLFSTRQLWCSGSVLVALNQALGGALSRETAIRLCAGLGDGMGGSGCLCGGLNGGALAIGLFLGNGRLSPGGDQAVLQATRTLHRQFKSVHGSTCCRILTKQTTMGSDRQYRECAGRTAHAARLAAELILRNRPELVDRADWDFVNAVDGALRAQLKVVVDWLKT